MNMKNIPIVGYCRIDINLLFLIVSVGTKFQNINQYDSFHRAIMPVLVMIQCFGIMPVVGVTSSDVRQVRYKTKSFRFAYSLFTLLCILLESVSALVTMGEIRLNNIDTIFYRLSSMFGTYQFFLFAKKWPEFIRKWTRHEMVFLGKIYKNHGKTLKFKIRVVAVVIFTLAFTEHILYLFSQGFAMEYKMEKCNLTVPNIVEHYYRVNRRHIFVVFPFYHDTMVVWMVWLNFVITVIWNFMDIFTALVGIALSHRINQLNRKIREATRQKNMQNSDLFWYQIRTHFVQITDLVDYSVKEISQVVISALACDMYFICLQFFNLFKKRPYQINYIFFFFSTSFFIVRTFTAVYCASMIHDSAQQALNYIRMVPSLEYSLDLKRFFEHIRWDIIAYSGKKFFFLTRGALLTMGGYIFTYELLLTSEKGKFNETFDCRTA
ncbi:gustatory receptor for sugar taste 64a-like [Culicoides brevitarsis]|uniref:gustatory receptor for sugar taste 64a-like n=1 Tax=Culicoides brevitarsis TaxID=469753 RepID=UPI00307C8293